MQVGFKPAALEIETRAVTFDLSLSIWMLFFLRYLATEYGHDEN